MQSIFEQIEWGTKREYVPTGPDDAHFTKDRMANSTLQPSGLGSQFLGLCHYAYGCNNLCRDHFALGRIMSHPAFIPNSPGEDGS